mmetsp:Transcript_83541/g.240033  ORF Transcript_83541/g.240033 Transcript_83541/m.240033 type:complete len:263 (+) Transcript_83541:449-1237(+)
MPLPVPPGCPDADAPRMTPRMPKASSCPGSRLPLLPTFCMPLEPRGRKFCSPISSPNFGLPVRCQASFSACCASLPMQFPSKLSLSSASQRGRASARAAAPRLAISLPRSSRSRSVLPQSGSNCASSCASRSLQPRPAYHSCASWPKALSKTSRYSSETKCSSSRRENALFTKSAAKFSGVSGGRRWAWHSLATWLQFFQPALSKPKSKVSSGGRVSVARARSNFGHPRSSNGVAPSGTLVSNHTSTNQCAYQRSIEERALR